MTRRHTTRRVVFVDHPALPEVLGYGHEHGWKLIEEIPAGATKHAPRELVFKAGQASLEVHLCEDEITQNSYAFVVGATKNVSESLIRMIERDLASWSLSQLLEEVDRGSGFDELGRALIRLALGAPHEFDRAVYNRVRDGLQHPDERLRDLSIWVTSYTPWPEYRTLLRDVASDDDNERIRARAARMLDSFDAAEVREGRPLSGPGAQSTADLLNDSLRPTGRAATRSRWGRRTGSSARPRARSRAA